MTPTSPESAYCAVPGNRDRRTLEPIAAEVVCAAEALANRYAANVRPSEAFPRIAFIPMIVTNLDLAVCAFNPDEGSLLEGKLGASDVSPAPFVRFRKSLSPPRPTEEVGWYPSLAELAEDRERTVFVVKAAELRSFLNAATSIDPP